MADMSNQDFIDAIQKIVNDNNAQAVKNANDANLFTANSQAMAMDYNSAEAEKNRIFQLEMSNSAHQREVQDLQNAGLNPVLSANNGASTTSGASGNISGASGQQASQDMQNSALLANFIMNKMNNAQTAKNLDKQLANAVELKQMENANAMAMNERNIEAGLQSKAMEIQNASDMQASAQYFESLLAENQFGYNKELAKQQYGYNRNLNKQQYGYNRKLNKQNNSNAYKIARLGADASIYGSSLMASASRYGSWMANDAAKYAADQSFASTQYSTDNARANNPYGLADKYIPKIFKSDWFNNRDTKHKTGYIGNSSAK